MKTVSLQLKYDQWEQFVKIVDIALGQIIDDVQQDKDLNLKLVSLNLGLVKERIDLGLAKIGRTKFTIKLELAQALALYLSYRMLYLQTNDPYMEAIIKIKFVNILDKAVG